MAVFGRYMRLVTLVFLGALALYEGELDDSPGLQGIGLILVIGAVVLHWRGRRGKVEQ